jgi:hypothetical protein
VNGGDLGIGQRAGVNRQFINVAAERLGVVVAAAIANGNAGAERRIEVSEGILTGQTIERVFSRVREKIGNEETVHVQAHLIGGPWRVVRPRSVPFKHRRDVMPPIVNPGITDFGRDPARRAIGTFDMEKYVPPINGGLLEGEPVRIAALPRVAAEEDLLDNCFFRSSKERENKSIGLLLRFDPALDGEGVGEMQLRRIAEFDLVAVWLVASIIPAK